MDSASVSTKGDGIGDSCAVPSSLYGYQKENAEVKGKRYIYYIWPFSTIHMFHMCCKLDFQIIAVTALQKRIIFKAKSYIMFYINNTITYLL